MSQHTHTQCGGTNMSILIIGVVVLVAWKIGSFVARFLGSLLIILTIAGLIWGGPHFGEMNAPLALAVGLGLWLFGHWLFAFKNKGWRSSLALRVFSLPLLRLLAPVATNHIPAQPAWVD